MYQQDIERNNYVTESFPRSHPLCEEHLSSCSHNPINTFFFNDCWAQVSPFKPRYVLVVREGVCSSSRAWHRSGAHWAMQDGPVSSSVRFPRQCVYSDTSLSPSDHLSIFGLRSNTPHPLTLKLGAAGGARSQQGAFHLAFTPGTLGAFKSGGPSDLGPFGPGC